MPRTVALFICAALFAGIAFLNEHVFLQRLELRIHDVLLSRTMPRDERDAAASRVAVIGITEDDLQTGGVHYPISDEQMTALLNVLLPDKDHGARAVGIDIFREMAQPDAKSKAPPDRQRKGLIDKLKDPRVFSVIVLSEDGTRIAVGAPPELGKTQVGFADQVVDRGDDVARRALLTTGLKAATPGGPAPTESLQSLNFRVARRYLRAEKPPVLPTTQPIPGRAEGFAIALGRAVITPFRSRDGAYVNGEDGGFQTLLDFQGFGHIPQYSAADVLSGKVPPAAFDGRAVFIGMTALSVKDTLHTPLADKLYGVMLHALIVDQLLREALDGQAPMRVWPDAREYLWAAAWTLIGGWIGFAVRVPWRFALTLAGAVALCAAIVYVSFAGGLWIPALPGLIGCIAAAGFVTQYMAHHERGERAALNELFTRMVDKDVAQTLWDRRDELFDHGQLAAREVRATVLFTDLENFTTITESMDKQCLMAFLNDYMTVMSGVVGRRRDAFVNKYIGDSVMAVFGPPLDRTAEQAKSDAANAVGCALEMRQQIAEHRNRWERACSEGIQKKTGVADTPVRLRMRVGIQSGVVTAGSLGSSQRLEYTVIGDTVNTAARLESFDKEMMPDDFAAGGCRILIGQDTLDLLPAGEYRTREVGSIGLKGKNERVTIHGVVGQNIAPSSTTTNVATKPGIAEPERSAATEVAK